MSALRKLLVLVVILFSAAPLRAQPAAPPPPEKYKVALRYRIIAPRDTHVAFYKRLVDHLESLNFEFDPPKKKQVYTDQEDPTKDRLEGLLPSDKALQILQDPSVAGLLLMPPEWVEPDDLDKPVRVRIELTGGYGRDKQRELAAQVRVLLGNHVNFREAVGYDHHGYSGKPFTRLVGTVPAGLLDLLLKDLRRLPTGWLALDMDPDALPLPVRGSSPIRVTEVMADDAPLIDSPDLERRPVEFLDNLSPPLWNLVKDKDQGDKEIRVELVLTQAPREGDKAWRERLRLIAPSLFIEDSLGQFVTATVQVRHVPDLASLPAVSVIRFPQPARAAVDPGIKIKGDNLLAMKQSGLFNFHRISFRGRGVRLAILDHDFRGYEDMIQARRLPIKTRLVDLTAQKNFQLYPDPWEGDPKQLGHGTHCAMAAALAAPDAELILIRIDGTDPQQLFQVIRHIGGDPFANLLDRRKGDIIDARAVLERQRRQILKERRRILVDYTDDLETMRDFQFLGPLRGWIFSDHEWSYQRLQYQDFEEETWKHWENRYWKLIEDISDLKGIHLVVNSFVWNDGYPLSQASPLTRWFDDVPGRIPLWFQAAGNVRGQSWNGLYRDDDGNGIMEFAPPTAPIAKGRWNHELNFLGWQPWEGDKSFDLPAKAKVRLSLQWREPHDPDYFLRPNEEDFYRKPLAPLRMTVLRQRDPDGKAVSADSFDVIARSLVLPERLAHAPTFSTYEQLVEFVVEKPGRYAVRIERQLDRQWLLLTDPATEKPAMALREGLLARGIRPLGTPSLPGTEKSWELRPRLFCQVLDEPARMAGRPVWVDYVTDLGSLGIPSDSRSIFTIGSANLKGKTQPYSPIGPPANLELLNQPMLLAYDTFQLGPKDARGSAFGTHLAASFAAGAAACLLSSGMTPQDVRSYLNRQRGKVLHISGK